jgi:hypothetical protein
LGIKRRGASLNNLIHTKILIKDRLLAIPILNERRRRRYLWLNVTNVAWNIEKRIMALAFTYNSKRLLISGIKNALRNGSKLSGNHNYMDHILSYVLI